MRVRGIRGATTANENTKESILEATRDLLEKLVEANGIDADDIASALFTSTEDLDAGFPAEAARRMGWQYVALLGSSEVPVPGAVGGRRGVAGRATMYGAVIGDIVGSRFEGRGRSHKSKDFVFWHRRPLHRRHGLHGCRSRHPDERPRSGAGHAGVVP